MHCARKKRKKKRESIRNNNRVSILSNLLEGLDWKAPGTAQWQCQRSKGARSFRGQKILQPGHPDTLFFSKRVDDLFSCRPQNTGRQRRFTVKIKQLKRSDMGTFLFSVHVTEAKQYAGLGRAEPGLEPAR